MHSYPKCVLVILILLFFIFTPFIWATELTLTTMKTSYRTGERVKIGLRVDAEDMTQNAALYIRFDELPSDFSDCVGKYLTVNGTSSKPAPIIDSTFSLNVYNSLDCINYPDQPCLFDFIAEYPGTYQITAYLANPNDSCDIIAPIEDSTYCLPDASESSSVASINSSNTVQFEIFTIPNDASSDFTVPNDASRDDFYSDQTNETNISGGFMTSGNNCEYFHTSPDMANFVSEKPLIGAWILVEEYDIDEESWIKIDSDGVKYVLFTDSMAIVKDSYTLCEEYYEYTFHNNQLVLVAKGNNCPELYNAGESFTDYINSNYSNIIEIEGNLALAQLGDQIISNITFENGYRVLILEEIDEDGEIDKTKLRRLSSEELITLWNHCPDDAAIDHIISLMNEVYIK